MDSATPSRLGFREQCLVLWYLDFHAIHMSGDKTTMQDCTVKFLASDSPMSMRYMNLSTEMASLMGDLFLFSVGEHVYSRWGTCLLPLGETLTKRDSFGLTSLQKKAEHLD